MKAAGALCLAIAGSAASAQALMSVAAGGEVLDFDAADVIGAESVDYGNGPLTILQLGPDAATAFALVTERHVGDQAVVSLCGKEALRATIMAPILGGSIALSAESAADAQARAAMLNGDKTCLPVDR